MNRPDRIVGLLLAGGKGTRMGGQNKGLIHWQGKTMAEWGLQALVKVTPTVFISANRSLTDYERLALGHILQDPPEFHDQGPLAGLLAGLKAAAVQGAEAVLVCPCDTPGMTSATLSALVAAWQVRPNHPAIAEHNGRLQPLHGVYPVHLIVELERWLASGNRRVMGFAESVGAVVVDCPEAEEVFENRNSLKDLER